MAWRPDYVTAAQLKSELLKITYDTDDAWIARVVTAASRAVDRHTRRQFGLAETATARTYPASWRADRGMWVARTEDFQTAVGFDLTVDGTTVAEVTRWPASADLDSKPWYLVGWDGAAAPVCPRYDVSITARWGWTTVPAVVAAATLLQAQRFYMRRDSWAGVAGSPDLGSEIRLLSKVDPDVGVMLADVVRPAAPA